MATVVHKNSTTPGNTPTSMQVGEIALNVEDRLAFIKKPDNSIVKVFDQYSKTEADAKFVPTNFLPLTRVGDTPYLPLDVKGDFSGAVVPTRPVYVLREPDGSVVGLRPGYNGATERVFYFYSSTGDVDNESSFIYTDTAYKPSFLRNDATAKEYVQNVQCCNQLGFLAQIRSELDGVWQRWYWIHTNGTMDPTFHSYVDVTDTMNNNSLLSLQYIKEFNGFMGVPADVIKVMFFNNNLPTNWVNNPSPASTTLTAKSVNCTNPLTGTTASATSFLNYDNTNYTAIIKPISSAGNTIVQNVIPYSSSYNKSPVNYQKSSDGVTLSMFISFPCGIVWSSVGIKHFDFIMCLRYNTSTNTLVWNLPASDQNNQSLPMVVDETTYGTDNTTNTGDPTSDAYKKNKYPVLYSLSLDGALYHAGVVDSYNFIDNHTVLVSSNTYNFFRFSIRAIDVSTATSTNKLQAFTDRPYLTRGNATYNQVIRSTIQNMIPYDASLLGKKLQWSTFISQNKMGVSSASRQYGQDFLTRRIQVNLPNTTISRKLDFSSTNNAFAIPTSAVDSAALGAVATEAVTHYDHCNTIIYSNGDYRIMPYTSQTTTQNDGNKTVNGEVIKVVNGDTLTYDATRGGSAGVAIFPTDAQAKIATLVASYASSSALGLSGQIYSDWSLNYIGDYVNGGTTYGLCLMQYSVQDATHGIEMGAVTLRLLKTGLQMAFSAAPASDVVSTVKSTYTGNNGNLGQPEPKMAAIGVLQYTDGRFFVHARGPHRGAASSLDNGFSLFEISANGTMTRNKFNYYIDNAYYGLNAGVHPDYGPVSYYSDYAYSQARLSMKYWPNATSGAVAKNFAIFDAQLTTQTAWSTVWSLTTQSAVGFIVYITQFKTFVGGNVYTVPTMSLDLTSIVADPSSKTFYAYLEVVTGAIQLKVQTTTLAETYDRVYIGTIVTDAQGISAVTLGKTTRLDLYRPSHDPYVGSSMPIPV